FGYRDDFEKKIYIDPKRPMVALTYDDGPYETVDSILYEILDAYGGRATFYAVGSRMTKAELDSIKRGIGLGMEFGSHSENHESLSKQDVEEAAWAIMEPVNYVKEKLGYEMKTYRPPYGNRNYELEEVIGMPAVLWTLDSKDWSNRDEDITHDKIINNIEDGDIVLMHSLYMSSANATRRLVPELIDEGYQLVTVSELLEYKGYDIENLKVIGNN
ncbi:MAG: polysaccharide deacetylase family protein, partial [Erysipelotrichaceae bacterium]|nr:polysaccharide deacetylase family protein [Erysipelotrichaceae bacterium]